VIRAAELISPGYRDLQRALHADPRGYGGKGDRWAPAVRDMVARLGATSVLDYGCGAGSLKRALRPLCDSAVRIDEYDVAIPGKDGLPSFADLVVCTDVLEHIEPDRLSMVLTHLHLLARKAVFAVIALRPANKVLADGRNAHLIIESADWWIGVLQAARFDVAPGPIQAGKPARELSVILTHAEAA